MIPTDLIKENEGLRLRSYQCQAGVWSIGFGHTKNVQPNQTCTKEQAEAWLAEDAKAAADEIRLSVFVPLTDNQLGALLSFVYNVGGHAFGRSRLLRVLNNYRYDEVPEQLSRWVNVTMPSGAKAVSDGLVLRRNREIALWNTKAKEVNV